MLLFAQPVSEWCVLRVMGCSRFGAKAEGERSEARASGDVVVVCRGRACSEMGAERVKGNKHP